MNKEFIINTGEYTVEFEYAESKRSIVDSLLNKKSCISALLGKDDYYSEFMTIKYRKAGSLKGDEQGVVGVLYNIGGYAPHITMIPSLSAFLLGYNESLAMYDMSKNAMVFVCKLPSPSFYCRCFKEGVVVLSELDITEVSYSGEIIKTHTLREILGEYQFSGSDFIYSLYDDTSQHVIHLFETE